MQATKQLVPGKFVYFHIKCEEKGKRKQSWMETNALFFCSVIQNKTLKPVSERPHCCISHTDIHNQVQTRKKKVQPAATPHVLANTARSHYTVITSPGSLAQMFLSLLADKLLFSFSESLFLECAAAFFEMLWTWSKPTKWKSWKT